MQILSDLFGGTGGGEPTPENQPPNPEDEAAAPPAEEGAHDDADHEGSEAVDPGFHPDPGDISFHDDAGGM